jgi:hypothetical protein
VFLYSKRVGWVRVDLSTYVPTNVSIMISVGQRFNMNNSFVINIGMTSVSLGPSEVHVSAISCAAKWKRLPRYQPRSPQMPSPSVLYGPGYFAKYSF